MTVPITSPTPGSRLAGARRDVEVLKRRVCGPWVYVGTAGVDGVDALLTDVSPPYTTGTNSDPPRQVTRFRWLLGGGVEIQIHASGVASGDTIFTLPTGYYDPDFDPPGSGHDDTGAYMAWHIDGTTGDVVVGV